MRPAKLHERILPTKFQFWRAYLKDSPLRQVIGPERFTRHLLNIQAIAFVSTNGVILCKTLNKERIIEEVQRLQLKPWLAYVSPCFRWLVRLRTDR